MPGNTKTGTYLYEVPVSIDIAGGVWAPTQGVCTIRGESGANDDLDTITPPFPGPHFITMVADVSTDITLKWLTGNLAFKHGSSYTLLAGQTLTLFYDGIDYVDAGFAAVVRVSQYQLYEEFGGRAIDTDNTAQSIYSSGSGTRLLPANFFAFTPHKTVLFEAGGLIKTSATFSGNTWTFELNVFGVGSITLVITNLASNIDGFWTLRGNLWCPTSGASATMNGGIEVVIYDTVTGASTTYLFADTLVVDTTVTQLLDILITMGESDANTQFNSYLFSNRVHVSEVL